MVAGLSVVHGLIPPHPAALLAVTAYSADIGRTILFALIVGSHGHHRRPAVRQADLQGGDSRSGQSADFAIRR
jgi:hypothetical protein